MKDHAGTSELKAVHDRLQHIHNVLGSHKQMYDLSTQMAKAAQAELEREVAKALADGYDGLDVEHTPGGTVYHPWDDSPPSYERTSAAAERYDFRGVTFADLREAHREETSLHDLPAHHEQNRDTR